MKKILWTVLLLLCLASPAGAIDLGLVGATEADGSPICYVYKIIFPNSSLTCNSDATATFSVASLGGGDVSGPSSNTANGNVVLFNATTGKAIKDSTFTMGVPTANSVLIATTNTGYVALAAGNASAILMMSSNATPSPVFKSTIPNPVIILGTVSQPTVTDASGYVTTAGYTHASPTTGAILYGTGTGTWAALAAGTGGAILMMSTAATPLPVFKSTLTGTFNLGFNSAIACTDGSGNVVQCTNLADQVYIGGTVNSSANYLTRTTGSGAKTLYTSGIKEDGTDIDAAALNFVTTGYSTSAIYTKAIALVSCTIGASCDSTLTRLAYGGIIETTGANKFYLPVKVTGMSVCLITRSTVAPNLTAQGSDYFVVSATTVGSAAGVMTLTGTTHKMVCVVGGGAANIWQVTIGQADVAVP